MPFVVLLAGTGFFHFGVDLSLSFFEDERIHQRKMEEGLNPLNNRGSKSVIDLGQVGGSQGCTRAHDASS